MLISQQQVDRFCPQSSYEIGNSVLDHTCKLLPESHSCGLLSLEDISFSNGGLVCQ